MRNAGPDLYPLCNVYYQYHYIFKFPFSYPTVNFNVGKIQYVEGCGITNSLLNFEWDGYLGVWREYGLNNLYNPDIGTTATTYNVSYYTNPDVIPGPHTFSPTWYPVGTKRLSYDATAYPYAYDDSYNGNQPFNVKLEFKKTCFNYTYQNKPQPQGSSVHSWYDKYFSVAISGGSNRLTAFGNWLNGTQYYLNFYYAPEIIDPFNPDSGQKQFLVWNTTNSSNVKVFRWTDSEGTAVDEVDLYYTLNWASTPIDAASYNLNYTGSLPAGPDSPAGTPQPGLTITANGNMPIRITAGVSNIGTIDPVFNLPPSVSATYFDLTSSSKLVLNPYPLHNLVKLTFLDNATITYSPNWPPTSYPPIYPIEINDLPGRYFYINLGAGGSMVISGFTKPLDLAWNFTPSTGGGSYYYRQIADYRVIAASMITYGSNTTADGVVYNVQITMEYTHAAAFANQYGAYGTGAPKTTYIFTGTTPRLPYTVGAKATFTLTMNSPTTPYQLIDLGTIEAEVLDI